MATLKTRRFRPNFSNALNIDSIISAPLVAASKANATILKGQTEFLLDYCFRLNDDGLHEPKLIKMTLRKPVTIRGGEETEIIIEEIEFEVPIIVLIPITTLAVTSLQLDFHLDIITHTERVVESSKKIEEENEGGPRRRTRLIGKVARSFNESVEKSDKDFREVKSGLNVSLEAESIDLPLGVTSLLDLYSKSITPILPNE